MAEERVSVGRLKARLSEYLKRVRAGAPVVVTSRGTPIARLVPLAGDPAAEGRVAELARKGLVRVPRAPLDADLLTTPGPPDPEARSLDAVLEERAEGW